jgi:hypothetical protein
MAEPTITSLSERLEVLERENRRIKRFGYALVAGMSLAFLLGQSQCNSSKIGSASFRTIETQRLVINDFAGKSHAEWTQAGVNFTDGEGNPLIMLSAGKDFGGDLKLSGNNGQIVLAAGNTTTYLMVSDNKELAQSFVEPAYINLWYAKKPRADLTAGQSGTSISFYDPVEPIPRVELGLDANGGNLSLYDKNHKTRAVIGSTSLVNPRGEKTVTPEESITLFSKDEKVTLRMPRGIGHANRWP